MGRHGFAGDILIKAGLVDDTGLALAVTAQRQSHRTLGRALSDLRLASESQVAAALADALHLEFLDAEPPVASDAAALLAAPFCRKRSVAPLELRGRQLRLAVTDPLDDPAIQDVAFLTGKAIVPVVVTDTLLEALLHRLYPEGEPALDLDLLGSMKPAGEVESSSAAEYDLVDPATLAKDVALPPVVKLVNLLLTGAASAGASDLHVEPHETVLHVRHRVDGLLHEVLTIPRHLQDATLSRLKIMSGMDIAERRRPQDGRSRLRFEGRRIDLRVSTLPTQFGEKIVIRLLNADQRILALDQLDLSPRNLRSMQGFLATPQGMILVTGPTGSGKTSTLYAALNAVRSPTNNIITLEDPIEIQVPGVNQTQINSRAGVTFASGLRSILRQDPNIILVGEIRDHETADVAFGAAQTGHLLLSTVHTNSAAATITRLFDLEIPPFMVATSLVGVVAQRLVRRICPACAVARPPAADAIARLGGESRLPANANWMSGTGCTQCGGSGFKGRVAVHEVLSVTDDIRALISARAPEQEIRKAAMRGGMRTLLEDGIEKAAQGITTAEEVLRVVATGDEGRPITAAPPTPAPAATAYERPAPASDPAAAVPEPPVAVIAPSAAIRKGRVLVVEDSPTVSTVVKYFLELEGFEVQVASDGREGLEAALAQPPDVIVSDVNMPGMGGIEMVKALRGDRRTAHISILMLTSESSVDSETEGLAAGADDYVLKPVEPRRLAARVKSLRARAPLAAQGAAS